ncbi:cupin domain-containing protein [Burkholderia plantarii]|uniref:cupin domain-containing protein n=1 Tax=Burkholderia plantarii TaxID=41899 RepID=UPI0018DC4F23|nr:cupin domain-containing protein [Burkholderia plantarii]MBI0330943.1 cupin domain-containing protein [Burkholderia plantarii]
MPASQAAADLIERFALEAHPEGGYFRETYRAPLGVARESDGAQRSASTAIYYLLCDGAFSTWHRIRSDEVWHFYAGDPLEVHVLDAHEGLVIHRLGNPLLHEGVVPQVVVPAGRWFGATCADPARFAFVGCTVAPGFEFTEFELAEPDALTREFPQFRQAIAQLTR